MKCVRITGPRQGDVVDVPDPHAAAGFAVVKVLAVPMCTEYKAYSEGRNPAALGHEAAGEVVETSGHSRVEVGDRVVVMPAFPCGRCALCLAGD
jgi:L-iditol 2-dehydrogenase